MFHTLILYEYFWMWTPMSNLLSHNAQALIYILFLKVDGKILFGQRLQDNDSWFPYRKELKLSPLYVAHFKGGRIERGESTSDLSSEHKNTWATPLLNSTCNWRHEVRVFVRAMCGDALTETSNLKLIRLHVGDDWWLINTKQVWASSTAALFSLC